MGKPKLTISKMMNFKKIQTKIRFLMKPKNIYKVLVLLAVLSILYLIRNRFFEKEGFTSSAEDFEKEIAGKKALVLFHADWCGHCKKFIPEWNEISKIVKDKTDDVMLVKVECGDASNNKKHSEIMKKYSIKGYPTIVSFETSGNHSEYDGDRSKDGILQFLGL
jgi:protein disulfide-isomerase-like protein